MKFTTAWANVMAQNISLKFSLVLLGICTAVFSVTIMRLAVREPLVIERGCYSKVSSKVDPKRTAAEIQSFVEEALRKRFDSRVTLFREYLSEDEVQYRLKEQEELAKKSVSQKIVVSEVKPDGANVLVEADRLIVVGKVRSSLYFPLKVSLSTTDRTDSNPYGLIVTRVMPMPTTGEPK